MSDPVNISIGPTPELITGWSNFVVQDKTVAHKIDFDKVKSFDDLKAILGALDFGFWENEKSPNSRWDSIRHLFKDLP